MHRRVSVAEVMGWEAGRDGRRLNLQEPIRTAAQKGCVPQCIRINPLIVSGMELWGGRGLKGCSKSSSLFFSQF